MARVRRIKIFNPNDLPLFDIREIQNLQGDLKSFNNEEEEEQFVEMLMKRGIRWAFGVWTDNKGVKWMISGNGRKKLFEKYNIRNQNNRHEFPIIEVHAKNEKEAAEMILEESSRYHKLTQKGLEDFTMEFRLDVEKIAKKTNLDGVSFDFGLYKDDDGTKQVSFTASNKKIDPNNFDDEMKMILKFPSSIYFLVKEALEDIAETPEDAIKKLLELD